MKAAVYREFKKNIQIEKVNDPTPVPGGVVLKVLATGLCLSDWHGWMGHDADIVLPHVPGHELVGEIVEVGNGVKNFSKGDRVTLPFVGGCGHCATCDSGNPQVCPNQFQPGFTHWGSFAEYVGIHYADFNLVHLPEFISNTTAASLGCRFATSYRGIVQQGRVQSEEWVVVFGCGGVGLSAIMIAASRGAKVIGVDIKPAALESAKTVGAQIVLNGNQIPNITEAIIELTKGGAHLTVDAIGNQKVLKHSILSLRRLGRHVQIGLFHPDAANPPIPMGRIIAYELELLGSHGIAALAYPEILAQIAKGQLNPDLLIDKTISLDQAIKALPNMPEYAGTGVRVITQL